MTFVKSSCLTLSRRFVGFNDACVFCFTIVQDATSFPVLFASGSARHHCWHRNFQLATRIIHYFLEFFICGISEPRNFPALASFVFSIAHFCFSLRFDASDMSFQISGFRESGLDVVCFLVSLSRDQVYNSGGVSFNIVNLVKRVHVSDSSRSPSTFQQSSILFSSTTSTDVLVALVASIYFSGIGNDASLGTYSLTLGSVRGALLTKESDSSFAEAHRGFSPNRPT